MHYKEIRRGLKRTVRHKAYVIDEPTIELVVHLEPKDHDPEKLRAINDEISADLRELMEEDVEYLRKKFQEEEDERKNQNK